MPQTRNPYAAPQAAVHDVNHGAQSFQAVKVFSTRGRMGRLRFLAYNFVGYFFVMVVAAVLGFAAAMLGFRSHAGAVGVLSAMPFLAVSLVWSIQRSHDMDWTGWTAVLAFVPILGLVWLFNAGTSGPNRFGAPPPPNGLLVKSVAFLLPLLTGLGIVAAVALPAYQGYVQRAKATQVVKP